jgi:predicted pyridoxine 5'-phosphate oxidase superfamily flavin-nucleotide-binding protein
MFGAATQRLQAEHGSRGQYERLATLGPSHDALGLDEAEFIAARDSLYLASVTESGWPYVQHRGGPEGFLRVLDGHTLAFADFAGNKQYITAGNLETDDRVALFLMDYPHRERLKIIGHARIIEPGEDPALEAKVRVQGYAAKVERIVVITMVAFDWNCSQHITPRWTEAEVKEAMKQNDPHG